jgi:2-iminoacetate synthase
VDGQFSVGDIRSLDEVISSIIDHGFIPSFCAACYRRERTGEKFMRLAKPGTIKGMCGMNALITLKEYLDDFASDDVKKQGYKLIDSEKGRLDTVSLNALCKFYDDIDHGKRDEYV